MNCFTNDVRMENINAEQMNTPHNYSNFAQNFARYQGSDLASLIQASNILPMSLNGLQPCVSITCPQQGTTPYCPTAKRNNIIGAAGKKRVWKRKRMSNKVQRDVAASDFSCGDKDLCLREDSLISSSNDNLSEQQKPADPFDPECSIPLPFQMGEDYELYGAKTIFKRNERERLRVQCVNDGYETLRNHLPNFDQNKRLSKVETLRLASRYINHLQELLVDPKHVYNCECDLQVQRTYSSQGSQRSSSVELAAADSTAVSPPAISTQSAKAKRKAQINRSAQADGDFLPSTISAQTPIGV